MNQIDKLAIQANAKIIDWSKLKNKLVVGIDGHTGAGKTSLLSELAAINRDILPVNRDDFQISRSKFQKLYKNKRHRQKLFELEMNDSAKLWKFIQTFRTTNKRHKIKTYDGVTGKVNIAKVFDLSKKIMVIEGVFIFHPKLVNKLLDKRIYIQAETKKIDKRRIAREKKRWGKDYFPETHPDSYFRQIIIALKRYRAKYKPEQMADLVLSNK